MAVYFAPMEGITGFVCRNAYEACFKGTIDKYFAPFITARIMKAVTTKDLRDILPERNEGLYLVPQLLANRADAFIQTAQAVTSLGYREINLNLGCPSKTVVTKKKGAGFLADPYQLDLFLDAVFSWCEKEKVDLSIKTRLGMYDEEEFEQLLAVYNKYPLCELIIHPRTQSDYYSGKPHYEAFFRAAVASKNPVCYNGDLIDRSGIEKLHEANPEVDRIMIGRGFLMHPGFCTAESNAGRPGESSQGESNAEYDSNMLWTFHDCVYEGYCRYVSGERNILFKMKELWTYFEKAFRQSDVSLQKALRQIRKSNTLTEYEIAVRVLKNL